MKTLHKLQLAVGVLALTVAGLAQANSFEIMNGEAAADGAYPWLVSIGDARNSNALEAHECGGSLITDRWVLTAAHCFSATHVASNTAVVVGRNRLSESTGQRIVAKTVIRHPAYSDTTKDNDVALIELSEPVVGAQPVRIGAPAQPFAAGTVARSAGRGGLAAPLNYLASRYSLMSDCGKDPSSCLTELAGQKIADKEVLQTLLLANGLGDASKGVGFKELVAAAQAGGAAASLSMGYSDLYDALVQARISLLSAVSVIVQAAGGSDEARQVDLPLVDNPTCQSATGLTLTTNMICAGYTNQPKDTCQGDSGGPLFVRNAQNSDWSQVGVVSFGGVCGASYGVYAKAANYLDWIGQNVAHFNNERLLNWAEVVAAGVLKPHGNERSMSASVYWARCYGGSGTCIGDDGSSLVFYDGKALTTIGPLRDWLGKSRDAGF